MANGGIIGTPNIPTSTTATGVWQQDEQYEAKVTDTWPQRALFTTKSARFNRGSSDSLTRTPSSASNRKTFTFSTWVKRSNVSDKQQIFGVEGGGNNTTWFRLLFSSSETINIEAYNDEIITNRVFRDVSAWYHIVLAVDTTQGTASNRVKLYINGTQETSFSSSTYPSQNQDLGVNNTVVHNIGRADGSNGFAGYLAETILIDGQQLAPTSFGVANSDGVWTPIIYTGTFGTNGFNLQFENAAALGTDSSPNGNTFTVNNLTSIDQSTDYPEVNFATWNSLVHYSTSATFSEGNLKVAPTENTSRVYTVSTIAMPTVSGSKWYAEFKYLETNDHALIGILDATQISFVFHNNSDLDNQNGDTSVGRVTYRSGNGLIKFPSGQSVDSSVTLTNNDIVMIALDSGSGKIWFGVNGTWFNSGNPATGSNGVDFTGQSWWTSGVDDFVFFVGDGSTGGHDDWEANFGSPPYAISSSNADGNGYGNFEYAVPSGYYALNTANLAEFG